MKPQLQKYFGRFKNLSKETKLLIFWYVTACLFLAAIFWYTGWEPWNGTFNEGPGIKPSPGEVQNLLILVTVVFGAPILIIRGLAMSKQARIAESGQITDQFTRAIDQLGANTLEGEPKTEVRLGAIYALERIVIDSPKTHRGQVMEILNAYVRQNRSLAVKNYPAKKEIDNKANPVPVDIQAALSVIIRNRDREHEKNAPDLSGSNLEAANFQRADLQEANLAGVNLQGAALQGANLQGANLMGATLYEANFYRANLLGASLYRANLYGATLYRANLFGANLVGATLYRANFQGAILRDANFQRANLQRADLQGLDLEGVNFQGAELQGANLMGANFKGADLLDADLQNTLLQGATNLTCDQLQEAKNWKQSYRDKRLACGAEIRTNPKEE